MNVSPSSVDPTRSSLVVVPVKSPWSGVTVIVSSSIDVDINIDDCAEEILEKTLSTIMEARGTIGKVGIVKVVESFADFDGCFYVYLYISFDL